MSDTSNDEDKDDDKHDSHRRAPSIFILPSRDELDENKSNETVGKRVREMTRTEKRLQVDRRAQDILSTPDIGSLTFMEDLNVNYFLSPQFVKLYQFLLISVYGAYAVMAIVIVTFYVCDIKMSLFDNSFVNNGYYIMFLFLLLNSFLSIIGCYSTFKIGISKDDAQTLRTLYAGIYYNRSECKEISDFMIDDGQHLLVNDETFITGQHKVKYELSKTLSRLDGLGGSLGEYYKINDDDDIRKLQHFVQMVYEELYLYSVNLRALEDRSKILRMFYDKQLGRLNKDEFDALKEQMDDDCSDSVHEQLVFQMPDFELFDKNDDHTIDLMQFEEQLDIVYRKIFDDIKN